jgi:hypothetical protein
VWSNNAPRPSSPSARKQKKRKRRGKNVKGIPLLVWVTGAVGSALAAHSQVLREDRLTPEDRLGVGEASLIDVVDRLRVSRPAFWRRAVAAKTQGGVLASVRRHARRMLEGFLFVSLPRQGTPGKAKRTNPRFYVARIEGMGLGLCARPNDPHACKSSRLKELIDSSWLSRARPHHVSHRSVVSRKEGKTTQLRELVGIAALLNAGCAQHVHVTPGSDFETFAWAPHHIIEPHEHVLMSYGMVDVPFVCYCGEPIA